MEELQSVRIESYLQQFSLMYFKHKNDTSKLITEQIIKNINELS